MSDVTYHVGKLKTTDHRIVVVFPQLPEDANRALVVNTDSLPPRLHDALMDVITKEGSTSPVLANILQRRVFTDTGIDLMNTLHSARALQSEPIDNVILLPLPNMPVPLRQALGLTANRPPIEQPEAINKSVMDTFNPHENNVNAGKLEDSEAIARNILVEAELLENEANRKKEYAYKIAPSLRPLARTAQPVNSVAEVVERAKVAKPAATTAKKKPGPKPGVKKKATAAA